MQDRDALTTRSVNLGLISNVLLSVMKTVIGILGHSSALLADGINSTSDVVYYIAVKIFMYQAKKPADKEHPYGHRQLESVAAIVVGAFILTTAIAIFWDAINKIIAYFTSAESGSAVSSFALYAAIATLLLKLFLYFYTKKINKQVHSPTIRALVNDHLNDIMATIAVIVGVVMGRLGYLWMDPAAGGIVAVYIAKTGVEIIIDSSHELMDSMPDDKFALQLRRLTMGVEGVRRIEELGVHRLGPYYNINMTIAVDGHLTIEEGHRISDAVEKVLMKEFEGSLRAVHIHYHPVEIDTG